MRLFRLLIFVVLACFSMALVASLVRAQSVTTSDLIGRIYTTGYVGGSPVRRNLDFTVTKQGKSAYLEVSIFDSLSTDTSRDSAIAHLSHGEVKIALRALARIEKLFKRDLLSNFKPTTYTYRTKNTALELEYGESYPVDRFFMVKVKNQRGQRTVYFEEAKEFREVQRCMIRAEKAMR